MTLSDSVFKSDSGTSPEKKNATTTPEKKDPTTGTDNHLDQPQHDDHAGVAPEKLHQDTWWGASLWKTVTETVKEGADYLKTSATPDQTVNDIEQLTFSADIFKTGDTKPTPPAVPDKPVANTNDISSWFSQMGDAVSSIGKQVTGKVTDGLDWIFNETDKSGNKTDVSAKNGEATVNGKNGDGVPVDVHVNKHEIKGKLGVADVFLDKDNKTGDYTSGAFKVHVGDITTVQNGDNLLQWDEKAHKGFIADKNGKHLYDFTSKDELTQELSKDKSLTQTQGPADQAADQMQAKMNSGETARKTMIVADHNGNFAVVREDGLMVKTYKANPAENERAYVTVEKDGHIIKIQDKHAYYQQEDPTTHAKTWVEMRGRGHRLPPGLQVDENTGAVAVDGKQVVAADGSVQADATTHIDMKTNKMTTGSDTGTVTVDNENGRTHVRHPGCGDIVNDGHTFVNMDPKTRGTFSSMDSDTGDIRAFGGKNGSGVTLNLNPGGLVTVREANGQVTQMSNTGYFNSVDAQGHSLMSVDTAGNATFYDGTTVGADGTVSNSYGDANAWDGGQSASSAIANASSAIGAALAASSQFDPNGSSLAALDAADAELSGLAATYTAMGRLDLVAQISNTMGSVDAARAKVLQIVGVSSESERRLGDGSASRVKEAVSSGSPENFIRNQEQQKRSEVA